MEERTLADTALREMLQLRQGSPNITSSMVMAIAHTVAIDMKGAVLESESAKNDARADAWLAVCKVGNKLAQDPAASDLGHCWDDAINKLRAWHDLLA
jgi:hypothetical protein